MKTEVLENEIQDEIWVCPICNSNDVDVLMKLEVYQGLNNGEYNWDDGFKSEETDSYFCNNCDSEIDKVKKMKL